MKAVALIAGWCFCLFATLGLLRPKLMEFGSHRISADYDAIPDRLVSWAIIIALWWGWIQCARNFEGEPDDFKADGYAVNADAWTDKFLEYDYIGAPFPLWAAVFMRGSRLRRVGCGGFCLRSRRFLEASAKLHYDGSVGEDIYVSRQHYRHFEECGCKFAPVPLALRWCMEHRLEDYPNWNPRDSFGRHGLHNGKPLYALTPWQAFWRAYKRSRAR